MFTTSKISVVKSWEQHEQYRNICMIKSCAAIRWCHDRDIWKYWHRNDIEKSIYIYTHTCMYICTHTHIHNIHTHTFYDLLLFTFAWKIDWKEISQNMVISGWCQINDLNFLKFACLSFSAFHLLVTLARGAMTEDKAGNFSWNSTEAAF